MGLDTEKLSESLPHEDRLPHTRFSTLVSQGFTRITSIISWIWLALVVVIVVNVTARYLFGEGRVEFEELQWHLYAIGFLVAMSTCMDSDSHIRVDVFHARLSLRWQAWIELYGLLLFFLPFVAAVFVFSMPFVAYSFALSEISDAPGGLPFRWAIKSFLTFSMVLLFVAGISRLSRVTSFLFERPLSVR